MHLGIKVGPVNWRAKLDAGRAIAHAEVWYDLRRGDDYGPLYAWLRAHGIRAGLHASTPLDVGLMPNLATADAGVRRASRALFRRIVDAAAAEAMSYVVIHPGSGRNWGVRQGRTVCVGETTPPAEASRRAIEGVLDLAAYGRERGVELIAENLPAYDFVAYDPEDRSDVVDVGFLPHTVLRAMGEQGAALCVDVGHLYGEMMARAPGEDVYPQVLAATRELAPYTRHVHLSTIVPPWNGTDSHNGFLEVDYAQGAVPGRTQLVDWLRIFAGRDVTAIPEPDGGADVHVANYDRLRAWMENLD